LPIENYYLEKFKLEKVESIKLSEGFRLIHNLQSIELFAETVELRNQWFSHLKQYCILQTFFVDY